MEKITEGKPAIRTRRALGLLLAAALLAAAAAGLWYVKIADPDGETLLPPCVFHQLTGLYCSGCGMGRALHYLMNGEFYQAFRMNPLAVASLPFLTGFSVLLFYRLLAGKRLPDMPGWLPWTILAAILAYTVLRNLPWAPFSWLAPTIVN